MGNNKYKEDTMLYILGCIAAVLFGAVFFPWWYGG